MFIARSEYGKLLHNLERATGILIQILDRGIKYLNYIQYLKI